MDTGFDFYPVQSDRSYSINILIIINATLRGKLFFICVPDTQVSSSTRGVNSKDIYDDDPWGGTRHHDRKIVQHLDHNLLVILTPDLRNHSVNCFGPMATTAVSNPWPTTPRDPAVAMAAATVTAERAVKPNPAS